MVTRIVLIRHALIEADGRLCGSLDLPLSRDGRHQLRSLLERPATRAAPDALFTSTLRRAHEVACALGPVWELPVQRAEWAREIHCGVVEGMPIAQVQREFPDVWARNEAQADDAFGWPAGETYQEFRARVVEGLTTVASRYAGQRVAVVTHAGVISQVLGIIRNRPACAWAPDRPRPLTATEIVWHGAAPAEVLTYSDPAWY